MLEARLQEAVVLKRLLDAIKELVTDANFDCNEEGINLQAMDNSHVALVSVKLKADGFKKYRCDRPMPLGVNLGSLTKVLKCAKDDDICVLKASDDGDLLSLTYEAKNSDRIAEYDMKLMDIDADQLGIPETEYDASVTMLSSEFLRIVRDLSQLGESVKIEVSKEGVRFAADGEAANGSVLLKQTEGARRRWEDYGKEDEDKVDDDDEGDEEDGEKAEKVDGGEENGEDDDEQGGSKSPKKKSAKKANGKANGETKVKKEKDGDVEMEDDDAEEDDGGEFKAKSDDEGEEEADADDDDEEGSSSKKRKRAPTKNGKAPKKARASASASTSAKGKRKSKKGDGDDEGNAEGGVRIEMNQHVALSFSLKYLVNFAKSASLSDTVQIMMSGDVPLLVSYKFEQGHIQYYLAPKIGDE